MVVAKFADDDSAAITAVVCFIASFLASGKIVRALLPKSSATGAALAERAACRRQPQHFADGACRKRAGRRSIFAGAFDMLFVMPDDFEKDISISVARCRLSSFL